MSPPRSHHRRRPSAPRPPPTSHLFFPFFLHLAAFQQSPPTSPDAPCKLSPRFARHTRTPVVFTPPPFPSRPPTVCGQPCCKLCPKSVPFCQFIVTKSRHPDTPTPRHDALQTLLLNASPAVTPPAARSPLTTHTLTHRVCRPLATFPTATPHIEPHLQVYPRARAPFTVAIAICASSRGAAAIQQPQVIDASPHCIIRGKRRIPSRHRALVAYKLTRPVFVFVFLVVLPCAVQCRTKGACVGLDTFCWLLKTRLKVRQPI